MGWFEGSSTRTPTSDISIMAGKLTPWPSYVPVSSWAEESSHKSGRVVGQASDVAHGKDVGDVAIKPLELQTVTDHENVGDLEADHLHGARDDAPDRLVEKAHRPQRGRPPLCQRLAQVIERQARIHDVLDDDDVPSFDVL